MNGRTCVWALAFVAALWVRSEAATIHEAAGKGDVKAVKAFLANGADVNAKTRYG